MEKPKTPKAHWDALATKTNKEYSKFRYTPMENIDELKVMFQNIHVSGASSVVPGVCTGTPPINVDDDIVDIRDDDGGCDMAGKLAKRKGATNAPSPKKGQIPWLRK
ncbi:hypothetical protein E2562_022145 [Oryza meyeriana var. granulata]|uniref:Myb/SANT-like domain-containing protein n=1 Tax=Oryza meyeriana var. granulata TaxID=110450 RepID=A0A6G1DLM7_9ORYZ|nr:hypothetical protein E2562_022145 [Oryza meyeriana var. granulata]